MKEPKYDLGRLLYILEVYDSESFSDRECFVIYRVEIKEIIISEEGIFYNCRDINNNQYDYIHESDLFESEDTCKFSVLNKIKVVK